MTGQGPGLHILAEMPYLQGMRWARATKELVNRLASWEHFPQGRPCLLLCGEEDRLVPQRPPCVSFGTLSSLRTEGRHPVFDPEGFPQPRRSRDRGATSPGQEMMMIEGEKHFSLPRSPAAISLTADWFQERLGG